MGNRRCDLWVDRTVYFLGQRSATSSLLEENINSIFSVDNYLQLVDNTISQDACPSVQWEHAIANLLNHPRLESPHRDPFARLHPRCMLASLDGP